MYIYEVGIGDSEDSSISTLSVTARNFDEAYRKGIAYCEKETKRIQRDRMKYKKVDRVPKSYAYHVASIKREQHIDL